ncbi:F-box/WD repeat-containing protein 5 [Drosophila pseudoobscura]|uniref:F-box/WD repeat-containing protein 5 n=1 Tax=Drosophila pseudoobscura pseudoobscura TaxID=46245 RepID=A0A6I8UL49_DROPS|nr:F-box/WD repeat-containing protein 5 [Drosophila pseudoobscura]
MEVTFKKARLVKHTNAADGEYTTPHGRETETCTDPYGWWALPEPALLKIFERLNVFELLQASLCCRRWHGIANDDLLWRQKFQENFRASPSIPLKPGAESWRSEYQRLSTQIPFVQAQRLEPSMENNHGHTHQVLHVSFAHNGEMFATCSKDGYVIVWNSQHPCTEKYAHNMKQFSWKYSQYSQFNQSDTLLLVSGVHFGSPQSTSGEIAVFYLGATESHLRCRVVNRPYDIFGTWFSDQYLISGDLHWLAHLVSTSVLWLNKANQEIDSEHVPIMSQLYKFYNRNASSVRAIMVARCPWLDESNDPLAKVEEETRSPPFPFPSNDEPSGSQASGNPLSHAASLRRTRSATPDENYLPDISERRSRARPGDATIHYLEEYRKAVAPTNDANEEEDEEEYDSMDVHEEYDEMENSMPKYLIFSTGSKTFTPHQIGFKRIRNVYFPKKLDPGPSLKERIAAKRAAEQQQQQTPRTDPDWWDYDSVKDRFDQVDKVIDLHGHIIGMALSPDHRYLYVNTRPWPKHYVITNPLEPPPIAQEIDIHVIDLMTLKRVGNMLRAHKAYTPSTECFFIFLDVCEEYVASGAEDQHAYLWDRYYGISLAKFKHSDVVNSVAFNPKDSEMLVTTSDDYTIKVWRSRAKAKAYNIPINVNESFELKPKK